MRNLAKVMASAVALSITTSAAMAGSHTWDVREVFTNDDGTIQFVELGECCGLPTENAVGGKHLKSDATGSDFIIPSNVAGSTANKRLLFATQGFADLGVVTPDYIIPDNFVGLNGDTLRYGVNPPANQYDLFVFAAGVLPTDCQTSIQITNPTNDAFVIAAATPTNYAGQTGVVDCAQPQCPWDCDGSADAIVNVSDLLALLGQYDPGSPGVCDGGSCDYNGDGCVDVTDLLKLLAHYDPAGVGCP